MINCKNQNVGKLCTKKYYFKSNNLVSTFLLQINWSYFFNNLSLRLVKTCFVNACNLVSFPC